MTRVAAVIVLASVALAGVAHPSAQMRGGFPPRDNQQEDAAGSAIIRGRIVAADTGAPIRRAQIRAFSSSTRATRLATSDGDGRFELRDLPAGVWELRASKAGFVTMRYGQRRPFEAGRPIEVRDAQVVGLSDFGLPRGGAITGRVYDEFGDPVAGARLQVLRYQMLQGTRRLMPAGINDESDDTGAFRLFGLMPGDYYVSATVRALRVDDPSADSAGYAPTYYPGTGNVAEAQRITVGLGQEMANVSFALLPVRTVRVTGRAITSMGEPLTGGFISLAPAEASADAPMLFSRGNVRGDGTFTLTNVAPGNYAVTVGSRSGRRGGRNGDNDNGEIASVPLTVSNEDISNFVVVTARGATLSGTVVAAPGSGVPPLDRVEIVAQAVPAGRGPGNAEASVDDAGAFTLAGLLGRRVIRVNGLPQDWMLESITMDSADVTDAAIELTGNQEARGVRVTITDRVTEVNGKASSGNTISRDCTVIVFPDDAEKWTFPSRHVRAARPDQQGIFRIRGLPPDDRYLAVAVDYLEEGEAGDPEFLEQIRDSATRFALGPGETRPLELRLVTR